MASAKEIKELERLSVISKVSTELHNHVGINDKTMAEFVVRIAKKNRNDEHAFAAALRDNGADFPPNLIRSLMRIIGHMTTGSGKKKKKKKHHDDASASASGAEVRTIMDLDTSTYRPTMSTTNNKYVHVPGTRANGTDEGIDQNDKDEQLLQEQEVS